jgi:hypothetical protein
MMIMVMIVPMIIWCSGDGNNGIDGEISLMMLSMIMISMLLLVLMMLVPMVRVMS